MLTHIEHDLIPPVFNEYSVVLILGTMPSPKSREWGFYYAHPQNRFWPVLAAVFGEAVPYGTEERKSFALKHGIALWDVLAQCDIEGASDAAIKNPVANDIASLLKSSGIKTVFTTGKTAARLYEKLCVPCGCPKAVELPSTSPANAKMSLDTLIERYRVILEYF